MQRNLEKLIEHVSVLRMERFTMNISKLHRRLDEIDLAMWANTALKLKDGAEYERNIVKLLASVAAVERNAQMIRKAIAKKRQSACLKERSCSSKPPPLNDIVEEIGSDAFSTRQHNDDALNASNVIGLHSLPDVRVCTSDQRLDFCLASTSGRATQVAQPSTPQNSLRHGRGNSIRRPSNTDGPVFMVSRNNALQFIHNGPASRRQERSSMSRRVRPDGPIELMDEETPVCEDIISHAEMLTDNIANVYYYLQNRLRDLSLMFPEEEVSPSNIVNEDHQEMRTEEISTDNMFSLFAEMETNLRKQLYTELKKSLPPEDEDN